MLYQDKIVPFYISILKYMYWGPIWRPPNFNNCLIETRWTTNPTAPLGAGTRLSSRPSVLPRTVGQHRVRTQEVNFFTMFIANKKAMVIASVSSDSQENKIFMNLLAFGILTFSVIFFWLTILNLSGQYTAFRLC